MSKCLVAMQRGVLWAASVIPDADASVSEWEAHYKDARKVRRDAAKTPDSEVKEMSTEEVRVAKWASPTETKREPAQQATLPMKGA